MDSVLAVDTAHAVLGTDRRYNTKTMAKLISSRDNRKYRQTRQTHLKASR
jgi:hypothetical protein